MSIAFLSNVNGVKHIYGQTISPDSMMDSASGFVSNSRNTLEGVCCLDHFAVVTTQYHCSESNGTWFAGHGVYQPSPCPSPCHADISGDGVINTTDFTLLLQAWGWCLQSYDESTD